MDRSSNFTRKTKLWFLCFFYVFTLGSFWFWNVATPGLYPYLLGGNVVVCCIFQSDGKRWVWDKESRKTRNWHNRWIWHFPREPETGPTKGRGGGAPLPSPLAPLTGHVDSLKPPGGSKTTSNPLSSKEGEKKCHRRLNCSIVKQWHPPNDRAGECTWIVPHVIC